MDGLAHIFLHVGLCNSIARLPAQTVVPIRVQMQIPRGDPEYDQTLSLPRGDGPEKVVEFDVHRGAYHLVIDVPKYACRASSYLMVLADQNRKIGATLVDAAQPTESPTLLMDGTAPMSFQYLKPTYVLFDHSQACNQPVGPLIPTQLDTDYDQGAYYLTMYADPSLVAAAPVFAVRFRTPTGLAHYVRLPFHLPAAPTLWPSNIQFNISDDMVAGLATEKTDTLLCPKIWGTSAG